MAIWGLIKGGRISWPMEAPVLIVWRLEAKRRRRKLRSIHGRDSVVSLLISLMHEPAHVGWISRSRHTKTKLSVRREEIGMNGRRSMGEQSVMHSRCSMREQTGMQSRCSVREQTRHGRHWMLQRLLRFFNHEGGGAFAFASFTASRNGLDRTLHVLTVKRRGRSVKANTLRVVARRRGVTGGQEVSRMARFHVFIRWLVLRGN